MVTNFRIEVLTILKATVLSVANEISEPIIDRINVENALESGLMTSQQRKRTHKALYLKLSPRKTRPPI
jgi:hypothetical protein